MAKSGSEIGSEITEDEAENNLVWLGLTAMIDAPRARGASSGEALLKRGHSASDDYGRSSVNCAGFWQQIWA